MTPKVLLALRLAMAVASVSWHVPDETWQSAEIAHKLVFGYGHQTWEWRHGLRSYLHPLLFTPGMYVLKIFGLDTPYLVALIPRVTQALLSVVGDLYALEFARGLIGNKNGFSWYRFLHVTSWFMNYCGSRTLVNTLELVLGEMALFYFSQRGRGSNSAKYVGLIALSFSIRPTTAIFWLPLALTHVGQVIFREQNVKKLACQLVFPAVMTLAACTAVDSALYGRFASVPWNFFKLNVMADVGSFYGTHPWHWYLSQGLPVILNPVNALAFAYQLLTGGSGDKKLYSVSLMISLAVYSLIPHKEFRFLLSLVPLMLCYSSECLAGISNSKRGGKLKTLLIVLTLVLNVPIVPFLSFFHQVGNIGAISHVANQFHPVETGLRDQVLILMPCHSTPFHSHLHRKDLEGKVRFLNCEPDLSGLEGWSENVTYVDEAEVFYRNPEKWLTENYDPKSFPKTVILYDVLLSQVKSVLQANGLEKCEEFYHALFPDGRVGSKVFIFCDRQKKNV